MIAEFMYWACLLIAAGSTLVWVWRHCTQHSNFSYVPFTTDGQDTVVVDCTAAKGVPTLTHHEGHNNPSNLRASDTSTGIVVDALKQANSWMGGEAYTYCQMPYGLLATQPETVCIGVLAVLRHMARIGDFKEGYLSPDLVKSLGAQDSITNIREALTALKLVCWLNTWEKRLFPTLFQSKDCNAKFRYFLSRFAGALHDPDTCCADWQDEYTQVIAGFDQFLQDNLSVKLISEVGLAIIRCPEPLHYYSLFSHTHGCDIVLTMYDQNRYEVECKYTQFVEVWSRAVWPRLSMHPLAEVLNQVEAPGVLPSGVMWNATRPLLRLQDMTQPLSKAQRYSHPTDRPFCTSSIPPDTMAALVQSFFEYGMQKLRLMRGGWSCEQLEDINGAINWRTWQDAVLLQHCSRQLAGICGHGMDSTLTPRASADDQRVL